MPSRTTARAVTIGMLAGAFALGYVCGSVSTRPVSAQLPGLLEKAGQLGGPVAAASQLGSSIVEMEQHVSGLQKNLDTLRKVQSVLTGK